MHPFLMYTWSPIRTFKTCIASPILVTGTVKWSQNVYCVSDYCQRLWHMYSCIRSESRRPDVRWHLYILPGNIRYPAEWTVVNVPVVFRMKIKISKPAFHFLFQELFALIYWRIKYFKLKYGLSLYGVYIGIWLFVLYHKQKYLLFIKVSHYNNQNF